MPNLSESIQGLLHLERPFPGTLAEEVRLGNHHLLKLHDEFIDVASELNVWTIYETIDSQLSGSKSGFTSEVEFGAPLVSIKSSLLGLRQEKVFAVDSDHANCASFGAKNPKTMEIFLEELRMSICNAEKLSEHYIHHPLQLTEHVKVELVGFYEDPDASMESAIRLYSAKYLLRDFLAKGPESCLEERLSKAPVRMPGRAPLLAQRRIDRKGGDRDSKTLSLLSGMQKIFKSDKPRSRAQSPDSSTPASSPNIVVSSPPSRSPKSSRASSPKPSVVMKRLQSLTVPALGIPDYQNKKKRSGNAVSRTMSEPVGDISPTDNGWDSEPGTSTPRPMGTVNEECHSDPETRSQSELAETSSLQDFSAGFSRPNPLLRRLMWIHVPFTNPLWVKVCGGPYNGNHA